MPDETTESKTTPPTVGPTATKAEVQEIDAKLGKIKAEVQEINARLDKFERALRLLCSDPCENVGKKALAILES